MKNLIAAAVLAMAPLATSATAHEFELGSLSIDHPMAFETAPSARAGAGYLAVTNNGEEADRLIEVRADFPKVGIHNMKDEDGVMKMYPLEDGVEIPAGETVELAPGGIHVMFMGITDGPLEEGEKIPATLVFEKAGEIEVDFNIEKRPEHGETHEH